MKYKNELAIIIVNRDRPYLTVTLTNYLALMMKDQWLQEVGFFGTHYKYSLGRPPMGL